METGRDEHIRMKRGGMEGKEYRMKGWRDD